MEPRRGVSGRRVGVRFGRGAFPCPALPGPPPARRADDLQAKPVRIASAGPAAQAIADDADPKGRGKIAAGSEPPGPAAPRRPSPTGAPPRPTASAPSDPKRDPHRGVRTARTAGSRKAPRRRPEASGATPPALLPSAGRLSGRLAALAETAKAYARSAQADNTQRAYAADWRNFASWLRRQGLRDAARSRGGRPLSRGASRARRRRAFGRDPRAAAVRNRLALPPARPAARHPRPPFATVLAGIRRRHARPPLQKAAIFADELLAMLATLEMDLRGLRDRAILAIGFAGGLRRSEIVGLDCGPDQTEDGSGWIEIFPEGALLTIRGKTGWREVEIGRGSRSETCPVALLETWLRLGRIGRGPLFRAVRARTAASDPSGSRTSTSSAW